MKRHIRSLCLLGLSLFTACTATNNEPLYLNENAPIEERVEDALQRMTLEEKVALCHAQSKFSIKGVPRLGIPEVWMSDGPHGVRAEIEWDSWKYAGWSNDSCTAFPALTCLAATWNPEMAAIYGKAVGEEARYRKKDIVLGPGLNIYRTPLNGRNFEYMGEDPCLAGVMVAPYIREAQKNGIATCVKHYALNNQETDRMRVNVHLSERALREIYLPAFQAAVDAGAWSFMGSYNKYLSQHGCHNEVLINQILKGEWGFDGAFISDWGGTHDTTEAAQYGLDIEMGTGSDGLTYSTSNHYDNYYLALPYLDALKRGEQPMKQLDDKARRVLRLIFRTVMAKDRPWGSFATEEHAAVARQIATEGIVLLKNDGILPLKPEAGKHIAVIGENATRSLLRAGGSSELKPHREISPLQAIEELYGKEQVSYALGYGSGRSSYGRVNPSPYDAEALKREAIELAKHADIVFFIGGLNKSHQQDCEDGDRVQYGLPFGQEELIRELCAVNPNVVVVIHSGNAVETSWSHLPRAIVQGWYSGSEAGHALTDILSGAVNPSGKLPFSFYARLEDCGAHAFDKACYPGVDEECYYKEDILVGYRWLQAKGIRAAYPFGYGLSYTTFELGAPKAKRTSYRAGEEITVSVTVTNSGAVAGKEVVQLYASKPESAIMRAPRELKAFQKVHLEAGESKRVDLKFDVDDLAYWDETTHTWQLEKGNYTLFVGNSSEATESVQIQLK